MFKVPPNTHLNFSKLCNFTARKLWPIPARVTYEVAHLSARCRCRAMAYEQPYHQQQYATGQQQAAAGHENWTAQNAQQQPPPTAQYAEWDPSSQQPQVLPQWYQKPSDHATEGAGPANEWIGGQEGINLFPLSSAKTPFSDYGTEGGSTVRSSPFPSGPRTADELPPRKPLDRICGVKRNVFFILVAITTFVLVVGIATGLGVGLALGKNSNNDIAPAQTRYYNIQYFASTPELSL